MPFAALNAGTAAMTKPALLKTTAIARKPSVRLKRDRFGIWKGAVSVSQLVLERGIGGVDRLSRARNWLLTRKFREKEKGVR